MKFQNYVYVSFTFSVSTIKSLFGLTLLFERLTRLRSFYIMVVFANYETISNIEREIQDVDYYKLKKRFFAESLTSNNSDFNNTFNVITSRVRINRYLVVKCVKIQTAVIWSKRADSLLNQIKQVKMGHLKKSFDKVIVYFHD